MSDYHSKASRTPLIGEARKNYEENWERIFGKKKKELNKFKSSVNK